MSLKSSRWGSRSQGMFPLRHHHTRWHSECRSLTQRTRSLTLLLALAFLASNLLSLALTHQLPDDPYNLARNYGWYLHLAGVVSVFGVIGCLRVCFPLKFPVWTLQNRKLTSAQEHAQSLLLFAHYLTLDTLLSSIPRLLLLTTFSLSHL